jgi:sarcosine oxidase subunit delta
MRIPCPHCGERGNNEFVYFGDADARRPAPCVGEAAEDATSPAWMDYVYMRANTAGPHREYWLHAQGCRVLLMVTRDTTTHAILAVERAAGSAA